MKDLLCANLMLGPAGGMQPRLSICPRSPGWLGMGTTHVSDCKWRGRAGCGQSLGFLNRKVSSWDTKVVECRVPGTRRLAGQRPGHVSNAL